MLYEYLQKVKSWCEENKSDIFIAVIIFLASITGFGLGRLSVLWPEKPPIRILDVKEGIGTQNTPQPVANSAPIPTAKNKYPARYLASKSGSYYHYPWCAGAQKIKEENKVWFNTKEEAEAKGYKPAGNCPGL